MKTKSPATGRGKGSFEAELEGENAAEGERLIGAGSLDGIGFETIEAVARQQVAAAAAYR